MSKVFYSIALLTTILFITLHSRLVLSEDPTRPPSWMTGVSEIKVSKEALTLQQVLISEDRKVAVINDQLASIGDTVEGARIKEIGRDWVRVMRSGRNITLTLLPITKEYVSE